MLSRFVREVLVPSGFRVVCTSRPEGVQLDLFEGRFVIFDLNPLSDEQQHSAIQAQLRKFPFAKKFADHVTAFASIRKGHGARARQVEPIVSSCPDLTPPRPSESECE